MGNTSSKIEESINQSVRMIQESIDKIYGPTVTLIRAEELSSILRSHLSQIAKDQQFEDQIALADENLKRFNWLSEKRPEGGVEFLTPINENGEDSDPGWYTTHPSLLGNHFQTLSELIDALMKVC